MSDIVKPVWLWLPEATEPVLVGEYRLTEAGGRPLGSFRYQERYRGLPQAMPLDQHQLARYQGSAKTTDYEGLFDIFRDVKPEGFGLDMLQRRRNVTSLSHLDALEYSPGDAVGALEVCDNIADKASFVPHSSQAMSNAMDELDPAQSSAHVVISVEGDSAATADNLLIGAKQLGIAYAEANDYLDAAFETIRRKWDQLAIDQGREPLVRPLFELPPRAGRLSEAELKRVRG